MNKKISNEKIVNFLLQALYVVMFIILAMLGIMALIITVDMQDLYYIEAEGMEVVADNIFINIIGICIFILVLIAELKIAKKLTSKQVIGISLGFVFILGTLWNCIANDLIPVRADQEIVFQSALKFIDGNFEDLIRGHYLGLYPYQIGVVNLLEVLIRIFSSGAVFAMRMINVISVMTIIYFLYKITDIIFHKELVSKVVLIISVMFIPLVLMVTFVYGNLLGLALGVMAIYLTLLWLDKRELPIAIGAMLTIAFAIIMKSNLKIFFVGILIVLLLELMKKWDKAIITVMLGMIVSVSLLNGAVRFIAERRSNIELSGGIPMICFVFMGIDGGSNGRMPGWYSGATKYLYYTNSMNEQKTKATAVAWINQRVGEFLHNPSKMIHFFTLKITSTWLEPTYQSIWVNEPLDKYQDDENIKNKVDNNKWIVSLYSGKINKVITKYLDIFQILIYLLSAIYFVKNIKTVKPEQAILAIIFIGGFIFHLVWETKSLYVLMYVILLFPYAAMQLEKIIEERKIS